MTVPVIQWLLESGEPWTRYRTMVDLLGRPDHDPQVQSAHAEMLAHPQVQGLIARAESWPGYPLQRHNDAKHPLYHLGTLIDFGVRSGDPGMSAVVDSVVAHQSQEGAFQSLVSIPMAFGGTGEETWGWMLCDAPMVLYVLLALGLGDEPEVQHAVEHIMSLVDANGWRCRAAPAFGRFRGPGRRDDPCPVANVHALKVLSLVPELNQCPAARAGAEMLLWHWENRRERKPYLFGMGTDFAKLKYPFIWYDILHVLEALSRFPWVHADARFREMVDVVAGQASPDGRYAASSMYQAWKGWSFADKKAPSPWLTFLVLRMCGRIE